MIVAAAAIFDMKAEWEDLEALLADTSSEGPVRLLNHIGNAATKAGKAGSAAMTAAAASNGGFRTASEAGGLPALLSTTPAGSSMYSAAEQEHRARPTFDALVLPAATPFATGQSSPSPFAVSQMGTSARQSSWAAGILDPLLAVSHPPNAGQSSWSPALTDPSLSNSRSSHKDFGRWPTAHLGTDVPSGMFDPWQQSWAIGSLQGAATASGDLFGSENQQQRSSAVHSNDPLVSSGHAGAQHNWASASAPAAPSLDDLLSNSLLGVHQTNWALPPSTFSTAQGSKDMGWRGHSQNTTVSSGMLQSSLQPTQDAMLVARARLQGQPLFSEDATRDARAVEVPREASDAHLMGEASSFRSSPQPDAKTSHPHHLSLY